MPTIIKDTFKNGARVQMDMDDGSEEVLVFHCPPGQGCKVAKWPLDSYHLPLAMEHYTRCCEIESKG